MKARFIVTGMILSVLGFGAQKTFAECTCSYQQGGICYDLVCGSSVTSTSTASNIVSLTITSTATNVHPGDTVTFSIRIRNTSNKTVRINTLKADLGDGMSFTSASNSGDTTDDQTVEWKNVDVDSNDYATLTLRVRINSNVRDGDSLRLRVAAGSVSKSKTLTVQNNGYTYRGVYYPNGSTSSSTCNSSYSSCNGAVIMNVTDMPDPVSPGNTLTYRIELTNNSNYQQTAAVRAYLDTNTTFSSASDNGYQYAGNQVTWSAISLYPNDYKVLTLAVRVNPSMYSTSTLSLRVDDGYTTETEMTQVSGSASGYSNDVCMYYNTYIRQNYQDYCDTRHEHPRYQ